MQVVTLFFLLITSAFGAQKQTSPPFCMKIDSEPECVSCQVLEESFEKVFHQDLMKRGYDLESKENKALTRLELPFQKGSRAFERVVASSNCEGLLYVQLTLDRSFDEGEDQQRVHVETFLELKTKAQQKNRAHSDTSLVVDADLDDEKVKTIEPAIISAVLDQTAQLWELIETKKTSDKILQSFADFQKIQENYIRLEGLESFTTYDFFKKTLTSQAPQIKLEERAMSPGMIQFAIVGDGALTDIANTLQQIKWGEMKLQMIKQTANEIWVTLK